MAKSQPWLTKVVLAVIAATPCCVNAPASADEIIALNPRSGVTQTVLLWQPSPSDPQVILLVFPGGGGNVGFETTNGKVVARTAYLFSRQRDLLERPEVAVAVIAAPSDQPDMDSEFRRSARHFEDMMAVARDLTSRYPKARHFDALKTPLLIVHHVKDLCPTNLFGPARKLTERFPAIVVDGPDETRPDQPCAPGTNHWFARREKETIDQVFNWIHGKAWSRLIR